MYNSNKYINDESWNLKAVSVIQCKRLIASVKINQLRCRGIVIISESTHFCVCVSVFEVKVMLQESRS